jgi:hypothetical protein
MVTYQYTLTIDDSQRIALEAALNLMIEECKAKLAVGEGALYWEHRKSCIEMLEKLRSTPREMTST